METEGPNARLKQYARCAGRSSASSAIRSWPMNPRQIFGWLSVLAVCLAPCEALAQSALSGDHLAIKRAAGHITIDGDLSDEGWHGATRIEKRYETQPGDNTEPPVKNVGYLTFDDRFFYAGFVFDDPNVSAMRAPYADRDNLGDGYADYGGVIIDSRNSGRTGTLFLVDRRGTCSTTPSWTMRRARISRRISSGTRRRASPITAGRSSCASRSRRCAIGGSTRRRGASSCTATIPRDRQLSVLLGEAAARRQLLHLPRRTCSPASRSFRPAAI